MEAPLDEIIDVEVRSFIESLRDFKHLISAIDDNVATTLNSFVTNNEWHIFIPNHLLSVEYSMESIEFCTCNFHFADAGTLLRKVRDDLLQFLMLYAMVIDIKHKALSPSYEKKMDISARLEAVAKNSLGVQKKDGTQNSYAEIIDAWYGGSNNRNFKEIMQNNFGIERYKRFLVKYPQITEMIEHCWGSVEEFTSSLRQNDVELNNIVHLNGREYVNINITYAKQVQILPHLKAALTQISIVFISFLLVIDSSLVRSPDYIFALEENCIPEENSQYWILNGVQSFIDNVIVPFNPKIKKYLQEHNSHSMLIE